MSASATIYPSPIDSGDYLAVIKYEGGHAIPLPKQITPVDTCTIVILDQSGSMGQWVGRVCTQILPKVFKERNFNPTDDVNLILFRSQTTVYKHKVSEFPKLPYTASGGTTMGPVFPELTKILKSQKPSTFVRILTISDGQVSDAERACQAASTLYDTLSDLNLNIESTAIRLFTSSYADPDTRALSSVLQFNTTTTTPSLIDIAPGTDVTVAAQTITDVFGADMVRAYVAVPSTYSPKIIPGSKNDSQSPNALFKQHPWSEPSCTLPIGKNTTLCWVSKEKYDALKPTKLTLSDVLEIPILFSEKLNPDTYEEIISSRIDFYLMQIKLLRVVGTENAVKKLKEMSQYFIKLEEQLYKECQTIQDLSTDSTSLLTLKERLAVLYKTTKQSNARLGLKLAEIANMDATTRFNAAQAASFLRSTAGSGSASRGLIRRAGTDLDFDTIVKNEVIKMCKNLSKLEKKLTPEIESKFHQSFVSLATTIDGIRAVCDLAKTGLRGEEIPLKDISTAETLLGTLNAFEILSYLNIVGVPVQSTVGDYPDPYRYNINVIFAGHYCSLSDLMTLHTVGEGDEAIQAKLYIPGDGEDTGRIDNVVPLLENKDIYHFLMDNASQIMSFYSSIGMRRVIADIWETPHATASAALVKMMRVCIVEPNEVNFTVLQQLYHYLNIFNRLTPNRSIYTEIALAAKYTSTWKAVSGDIKPTNEDDERLNYLSNDTPHLPHIQTSITSLMYPLIQTYQSSSVTIEKGNDIEEVKVDNEQFAAILRSTYYNEVWNALRSEYRGKQGSDKIIQSLLNNLIGFDSKWVPQLTSVYEQDGPFEEESTIQPSEKAFFKSKTYQNASNKIQRLNILLAIPYFSYLFSLFDTISQTDPTDKDALDESHDQITAMQQDCPKFLSTPETYRALKKKAEIDLMKKKLQPDQIWGYDSDDDEDEEIHNRIDSSELQTKIDEYNEETKGLRDEVLNTIQVKWPEVFYNIVDYDEKIHNLRTVNLMKLYAIISAYTHPEPNQRFDQGAYEPTQLTKTDSKIDKYSFLHAVDFPQSITFDKSDYIQFIKSQRTKLYEKVYNAAVKSKIDGATDLLFEDYVSELLSTNSIETFTKLLSEGITSNQYSAVFTDGFRDPHLKPFWTELLNKDTNVPLRTDKLKLVILGRDNNNIPVWNQGKILYDHVLLKAAVFFYDENKRDDWIIISKEYADRRKWDYRSSDLPNRHSHHLTHPSYYGLGYDSLVDFKAKVDDVVYQKYCKEHKDCCGLTPIGQKRVKLGPSRNYGKEGDKNPKK